ncbi:MAG: type II secretion system F family protein [Planctomycetaceae bacterium]|nr:type II secretion system F family protein [Planctomycetaceae bacterium]MCP4477302.1 type II secretion system F family protein [Planctomycetaceae bacterium]MCP4779021.1 type II secretion system F family protein [Planctomycetaceae bacterium]
MFTYILFGLIAVGIGGMVFAASMLFQNDQQDHIEDRLASLTQNKGRGSNTKAATPASLLNSPLDDAPDKIEEFLNRFLNLRKFLSQTGTDLTIGNFIGITVAATIGTGVVTAFFLPIGFAPVTSLIAAILPFWWLSFLRKRRLNKFGEQLPAALDLMSQALRAGQSLPSGIQLVGAQVDQPLGPEFNLAFEQQNLGMTLNDSLRAMSERVPNLDLRFFVTAVVLQRQTGGDLAEVLDKISSLTRERFKIRGQIQALTGEGRISGVVLLAMPPVLFVVMMKLNYEYVMMLFEEPLGQKMLLGGLILQFIGAFSIKKIIDIKV